MNWTRTARPFLGRNLQTISRRSNASYQPPSTPPKAKPDPHRDFYKTFGRPIAKNFLIAFCTYQFLYWGWLKLESLETRKEKEDELHRLEAELRTLQREKEASRNTASGEITDMVQQASQSWKSWLGL